MVAYLEGVIEVGPCHQSARVDRSAAGAVQHILRGAGLVQRGCCHTGAPQLSITLAVEIPTNGVSQSLQLHPDGHSLTRPMCRSLYLQDRADQHMSLLRGSTGLPMLTLAICMLHTFRAWHSRRSGVTVRKAVAPTCAEPHLRWF